MTTTTEYGTWNTQGDRLNHTVEATIGDHINGGDAEWVTRVMEGGALAKMAFDYREAINAALPDGVTLAGNQFYGPYYEADQRFEGYPTDEDGALDIAAIIESIDLDVIVNRHDPDNA